MNAICVNPDFQRRGYGRKLFNLLLDQAHKMEAAVCFLEVRRFNTGAIELYKSMGFSQVGERKNYYPSSSNNVDREDALILSRSLPLP